MKIPIFYKKIGFIRYFRTIKKLLPFCFLVKMIFSYMVPTALSPKRECQALQTPVYLLKYGIVLLQGFKSSNN